MNEQPDARHDHDHGPDQRRLGAAGASVRVPLRPGFAAELAATARDAALTSIVERLDVERAEVVRAQERLADASASVAALEAALTELDR